MGTIAAEDRAPGVRLLTIDAEARRNAVDPAMLVALAGACRSADADGIRCVVLTGRGDRAFCAGYDLDALASARPEDALPDAVLQQAADAIESARAPVIAAVNGLAYGAGAELAAACDLRIGAPAARLAMPPARLGIVYAPAGLRRFVALVGPSQARRLFYSGDPVDAEPARAMGLLDEIAADPVAASLALADKIARNAPLAVAGMKRIFSLLQRGPIEGEVSARIEEERRASFGSEDAREGLAALRERREPRFRGR